MDMKSISQQEANVHCVILTNLKLESAFHKSWTVRNCLPSYPAILNHFSTNSTYQLREND